MQGKRLQNTTQALKRSGLAISIKVFEIGEVVQLNAKRKKFCKGAGIRISHIKHNMLFMTVEKMICIDAYHIVKYTKNCG